MRDHMYNKAKTIKLGEIFLFYRHFLTIGPYNNLSIAISSFPKNFLMLAREEIIVGLHKGNKLESRGGKFCKFKIIIAE